MPPRLNTVLKKQAREMMYNVFLFMKKEAEEAGTNSTLKLLCKRTADATKTSVSTVRRILREAKKTGGVFKTPGQTRPRNKPVTGLDSATQDSLKQFIHEFQAVRKGELSLTILLHKLQADIDFKGSEHSLRRIIKKLGFQWKKIGINRRLLVESSMDASKLDKKKKDSDDESEDHDKEDDYSDDSEMSEDDDVAAALNADTGSDSCMTSDDARNNDSIVIKKEIEEEDEKEPFIEIELVHIKSEPLDQ